MLTELRIRNVGVIDDVTLRFGPGLNVLTGETGAGKTMVVSALELLLGARADGDRVRAGATTALVEGSLDPAPAGSDEWLDEGDDELIVSREVSADGTGGRSRARLGGRMAPVSSLAACVGAAVELHGQSDTSRLAQPAVQRDLLDRFGGTGVDTTLRSYQSTFAAWTQAQEHLQRLRTSTQDRVREADRLRFELAEIDAVDPQAEADAALLAELPRLEHAEALLSAADRAATALSDDQGARDALATAAAVLSDVSGLDPALEVLADRVASLTAEAQDVALDLRSYVNGLEVDPARLDAARDRYAELNRLARKYGAGGGDNLDIAGVITYADNARRQLVDLESSDEQISDLERQVAALADTLAAEGQLLREERSAAGKRLAEAVAEHLFELAMAGARLEVHVDPASPTSHGADRVVFALAANPGEPALPLGKAASGGERSRVALALRLALADADDTSVLVFDEVDAGIGGATALSVGRKLARLARGRQVLCVTHLPQLAAYADVHFSVRKGQRDDRTIASVDQLSEKERITELSRMLSGSSDSAVANEHAAQLLAAAQSEATASG